MKLSLADLSCAQLDLVTEGSRPIEISLRGVTDGRGDIALGKGLTDLSNVAIRELTALLKIPLGTGQLCTTMPAKLTNLTCDARFRSGFVGEFHGSLAESETVELAIGKLAGRALLRAEDLTVKIDDRGGRVSIGTTSLQDAQLSMDGWVFRVGNFSLTGLKVSWDKGRPVEYSALKGHARDLYVLRDRLRIHVQAVDLPEGFTVAERITLRSLLVGSTHLTIDRLSSKSSDTEPAAEPATEMPAAEAPASGPEPAAARADEPAAETAPPVIEFKTVDVVPRPLGIELDHGVFDTVNGNLDVDLKMAATVPVLGRRTATHHFRIPIEGGIINYRDLERDLADLEDAFIDITLRGNRLVLERDIPLIPGLQRPILVWPLGKGDVELAEQHLVRLRTLPHFEWPIGDDEKDKKSRFTLHRLDFDNLVLALSLDETAVLKSGQGSLRAHCDELELRGNLHYEPTVELEPTQLQATAKGLGAVFDRLLARGHEISGELQVGAIDDFTMTLHKMRPHKLELVLKNTKLANLEMTRGTLEPINAGES